MSETTITDAAVGGAFPQIAAVGLGGLLVRFSDQLSEAANRAALAFRAEVALQGLAGVQELSTSLTGTFLCIDPLYPDVAGLCAQLQRLLDSRDWYAAPLPQGRRHLRIPCVIGGSHGPQWGDAVAASGLAEDQALASLTENRVRVLTIGFAPGQPYMGQLPPEWNIPRLSQLTPQVPAGALVIAIRQLIIFSAATPTGWRHIGQSAFRLFRPDAARPFALNPGDEVSIRPITAEEYENIRAQDRSGDGGAQIEVLA
ncbi:MAG: 5-oxoprolinase subunit B family protein [Lutimaribacter sp.]